MRKLVLVTLLFASTFAVAQNIQNSFFGYKLNSTLSDKQLSETFNEKYSRSIRFEDDDPNSVGIVDRIKFGGYEWGEADIIIYKPMQILQGVEFIERGTITSSCKKRYEKLLATLTEKYGDPVTIKTNNHVWTGKNGVNLSLVYMIEPFRQTELSTQTEILEEVKNFDRLTLKYWDVSVEEKVKQYEKDQL